MPRFVLLALMLTACGSSGSPSSSPPPSSPPPSSAAPSSASPTAFVSKGGPIGIAFSGGFVLDVARKGTECQTTNVNGAKYVGYSARSGAGEPSWWLTVIDDDAGGPHQPSVVLNLANNTKSFTWRRDGGVVALGAGPDVARLDVDLRGVATPGTVHVKGTLSCR